MTSFLLAGPAGEPVTLAQAKAHLRVDDNAEDGLIATLIAAARLHIEGVTGRAMLAQSWRLVLDHWPADRLVRLPVTPLISLASVTTYNGEGTPSAVALAAVRTDAEGQGTMLVLPPLTAALRERHGIEIDYVAGFGASAGDVPADLVQSLLMLVAHWFDNRDAVIIAGSGAVVPSGFDRLVANYRRVRL